MPPTTTPRSLLKEESGYTVGLVLMAAASAAVAFFKRIDSSERQREFKMLTATQKICHSL